MSHLPPKMLHLDIIVREPEVVGELSKYQDGTERDEFALSALRIGVLALRQANGAIDVNAVRTEGERLVGAVRELLTTNTGAFLAGVSSTLKSYFDPSEGHLAQRLDRLMRKDGELQSLLVRHLQTWSPLLVMAGTSLWSGIAMIWRPIYSCERAFRSRRRW
jgi:hypothetical protein